MPPEQSQNQADVSNQTTTTATATTTADATSQSTAGSTTTTGQTADTTSASGATTATQAGNDQSPAAQWEDLRKRYGEKTFGDLTKKEAVSALNELGRYATPEDALAALIEAKRTLRAGQIMKYPGKDSTPEQVKEWRAANGIPEDPKQYLEKLPEGLAINDKDLPLFQDFVTKIHGANAKPEVVHAAVAWYNGFVTEQQEAMLAMDNEFAKSTEQTLKQEYGAKYRDNIGLANQFIANTFSPDVVTALTQARMPDGRMLLDHPEIVHGFLKAQLEIDPSATVVPGGGGGMGALDSELKQLEAEMIKDRKTFYAEGKHLRMDEIMTAQAKMKR